MAFPHTFFFHNSKNNQPMARRSKKITLKDGFYIAVKANFNSHQSPILIRRETKKECERLLQGYVKTKNASYYGQVSNGKVIDG